MTAKRYTIDTRTHRDTRATSWVVMDGKSRVAGRDTEQAARDLAAKLNAEHEAAEAESAPAREAEAAHRQRLADLRTTRGPLATEPQVEYILNLLAARTRLGEGGGFMAGPTTREGIQELSRPDASAYINSLRGNY